MRYLLINYFNEVVAFSRTRSFLEDACPNVGDRIVMARWAHIHSSTGEDTAEWHGEDGKTYPAPLNLAW